MTVAGLALVYDSLHAEGHIPAAHAAALQSALADVQASSGIEQAAKLKAFATAAAELHSSAGTLLRYGAEGVG